MSNVHIKSQLSGTKNSLLGFASLHILAPYWGVTLQGEV